MNRIIASDDELIFYTVWRINYEADEEDMSLNKNFIIYRKQDWFDFYSQVHATFNFLKYIKYYNFYCYYGINYLINETFIKLRIL